MLPSLISVLVLAAVSGFKMYYIFFLHLNWQETDYLAKTITNQKITNSQHTTVSHLWHLPQKSENVGSAIYYLYIEHFNGIRCIGCFSTACFL